MSFSIFSGNTPPTVRFRHSLLEVKVNETVEIELIVQDPDAENVTVYILGPKNITFIGRNFNYTWKVNVAKATNIRYVIFSNINDIRTKNFPADQNMNTDTHVYDMS
jgi:hypothetical protein